MTHPSSPALPPRSPDGRWWWDGAQWQPVPDAPAPWPAQQPSYLQQPSHRSSTGRTVAIVVGVAVVVIALLIGGLAALGGSSVRQQQSTTNAIEVRAALTSAAIVEHTYAINNGTFIADQQTLLSNGFAPVPGIDVHVVSATADTFCIAGGPTGEQPILWATERDTALKAPCS